MLYASCGVAIWVAEELDACELDLVEDVRVLSGVGSALASGGRGGLVALQDECALPHRHCSRVAVELLRAQADLQGF